MSPILKLGRFATAVGCHAGANEQGGWEAALDAVVGIRGYVAPTALMFGFGWDAHIPVRPWPQGWWRRTTPRGNVTSGLAWFGLFVNVGRPK